MPRRLAAIMFTDMVGYSALAQTDEAASLALLQRHNGLLRPLFARFGGREIKTVGDAFLVEFNSALEATQCAVEVQRALHEHNATASPDRRIQIRIGVHVGDVVETDGDLLGDAVNIASRIEPLAEPGGICLTQQVVDQVQNKITNAVVRLPGADLKNIRAPPNVYRVVPDWESAPPAPPSAGKDEGRHLAVLPLANFSPDPSDGYFADGLTEELIGTLSQVGGLSVIARTSVTPYKTAPKSIAQVGADLHVDTVLEGSVRKAGNRMRISLQLIDVPTQRHIWANTYDRGVDDVFAVQTDIAERTAQALRLELRKAGGHSRRDVPTENAEAYDLYLRGLVAASANTFDRFGEAFACFQRATELDPGFAEAYATWGNLYVTAAGDSIPVREAMPRARELAARAIALDPESSDAHATLANIALQFDLDWRTAEAEFRRAISLNPSNTTAYRFYGIFLMSQGRFAEARETFRQVVRLDPSGPGGSLLAWVEIDSGNFDAAIELSMESAGAERDSVGHHVALGMLYWQAGRREEADREARTPLGDASENDRFDHALLNAVAGHPEPAQSVLADWDAGRWKSYLSPGYIAMLYANLGMPERALDLLEEEWRGGDRLLWMWSRSFAFDPIRETPRFRALLRQYGLPNAPVARGPVASKDRR